MTGIFKQQWKSFLIIPAVFLLLYFLPLNPEPDTDSALLNALSEAILMAQTYARDHVLLCLVPAFFIAGAVSIFINQAAVIKHFGPKANKVIAYAIASVSGSILAVCSCTVLPLFAGIYRMGAGIGPATTFLYAGPAINLLAIVLTYQTLGKELALARAIAAITFSIIIGLNMQLLFRNEYQPQIHTTAFPEAQPQRPIWKTLIYFSLMIAILILITWGDRHEQQWCCGPSDPRLWYFIIACAIFLAVILVRWFGLKWWKPIVISLPTILLAVLFPQTPVLPYTAALIGLAIATGTEDGETSDWFYATWGFARQILPLLLIGVLIAGFLLGRVGHSGLIPDQWIYTLLGGNSIRANLIASVAGALMYFATLTEIPIIEGLMSNGMGNGPALALLLAGPALSLPNILVIRTILGNRKTTAFILLVITFATISGILFGNMYPENLLDKKALGWE